MIQAYEKIISKMKMAELGVKKHTLDNEASEAFKQCIRQKQIEFELIPPETTNATRQNKQYKRSKHTSLQS